MGFLRTALDTALGRDPQLRASPVVGSAATFLSGSTFDGTSDQLGRGIEGTLKSVPLFAAIRLIADNIAAAPLHAHREMSGGVRTRLDRDPAFLRGVRGGATTFKKQCILSLLGAGNAYGYITGTDPRGTPEGIVWLDPQRVFCEDNPLAPNWRYDATEIPDDRMVHIPWLVPPGKVKGLSPIQMHRAMFQTGFDAQNLAGGLYRNNGVPIGHLRNTKKSLQREEAEEALARFTASTSTRKNFVSGEDWEYHVIGLTTDQIQYVQAMQMTATQVASIFGVSPEDIGGTTGSSLTYNTVEMNALKLATQTLRPYCVPIEDVLSQHMPEGEYLKFNLDAGVRADLKTRMEASEIGIRTGVLTLDEARALEDRPPLTPEQLDLFKATQSTNREISLPEAIQKTYLGVGAMLTPGEARTVLNGYGADLSPDYVPDEVPPAKPLIGSQE